MSSLNIKNEETVALIRELADRLGVSMTAAVTQAVQHELRMQSLTETEIETRAAEMERVWRSIGELPGVREYLRQDFDEMLYDERGLPK